MSALLDFMHSHSTAGALLALALVAFTGLGIGSIRFRGIGLGVAGILFSGIFFGHIGFTASHEVLEFARDAGLVLFVYTIGIQVGPGFVASLRHQGLTLNSLSAAIVLLGGVIAVLIAIYGGVSVAVVAGLFAGATTNTPALGAAQEAIKSLPDIPPEHLALPALGYAVSYPFGIIGIILVVLIMRGLFNLRAARQPSPAAGETSRQALDRRNVLIENARFDGLPISRLAEATQAKVVISRIKKRGDTEVSGVKTNTVLEREDIVLAVGDPTELNAFCEQAGSVADIDLMKAPGRVEFRQVVVTRNAVLGQSLREVALEEHHGVTVTRLNRANVELTANADQRLLFGDLLTIVGEEQALNAAARELGNSVKALNATDLLPNLLGIALGICLGFIPIPIPGLPAPAMLGIAGGPLLVAILLSRIGCIGPLRWYLPASVNSALRELGIAIFLASVGLMAGDKFLDVLLHGDGLSWMACGVVITLLPLLIVGLAGCFFLKLDFAKICGLLAGSMTDPPALAFANAMTRSNRASETYATVYPLTMTLRILLVQAIIIILAR